MNTTQASDLSALTKGLLLLCPFHVYLDVLKRLRAAEDEALRLREADLMEPFVLKLLQHLTDILGSWLIAQVSALIDGSLSIPHNHQIDAILGLPWLAKITWCVTISEQELKTQEVQTLPA